MFLFNMNWLRGYKMFQKNNCTSKKGVFNNELNEISLSLLKKKKQLEILIIERLEQEIFLSENKDFLVDLKKEIQNLNNLDYAKKVEASQLKSEVNYLENVLTERFEELDKNEIKFCAYFRLGFSSKEISIIEDIDLNDVRFHKSVIRRKLNLNSKTSLKDYLIFEE